MFVCVCVICVGDIPILFVFLKKQLFPSAGKKIGGNYSFGSVIKCYL